MSAMCEALDRRALPGLGNGAVVLLFPCFSAAPSCRWGFEDVLSWQARADLAEAESLMLKLQAQETTRAANTGGKGGIGGILREWGMMMMMMIMMVMKEEEGDGVMEGVCDDGGKDNHGPCHASPCRRSEPAGAQRSGEPAHVRHPR
jgi:hypothetical protein